MLTHTYGTHAMSEPLVKLPDRVFAGPVSGGPGDDVTVPKILPQLYIRYYTGKAGGVKGLTDNSIL